MNKIALATLAVLSASLALADDFKTIDGKEYKNTKVSRVEPDGLVLLTKSGISKIYFTELPKDVQERFHYDAQKAAEFTSQTKNGIDQLLHQRADDAQKRAEENAKYWEEQTQMKRRQEAEIQRQQQAAERQRQVQITYGRTGPDQVIYGTVANVVDEGLLVSVREMNVIGGGEHIPNGATVLLIGNFPGFYDDDRIMTTGFPVGRHEYTTVMGSKRTARAFLTTHINKLQYFPQ